MSQSTGTLSSRRRNRARAAFYIFLLRHFFLTLPPDLEDAAISARWPAGERLASSP